MPPMLRMTMVWIRSVVWAGGVGEGEVSRLFSDEDKVVDGEYGGI